MLIASLETLGGFVLLLAGGEALVRGATGIAFLGKLSPAVVGVTVVALGTSMPELVVSVQSALRGSPGLALGNVVGSNIFNLTGILGVAALIHPLRVAGTTVRLEWPVMLLAVCQLHLLGRDGMLDRLEGGFLLSAMVAFLVYVLWLDRISTGASERQEYEEMAVASFGREGKAAWALNVVACLAGASALAGGAALLVGGATTLARGFEVSESTIGLTVLAMGTSLPELAASAVAAWRGRDDIAVANVVGSNVFNILCIVGATALIHPLAVPSIIWSRDNAWLLGFSVILFPLMRSGMRVNRLEGGLLLLGFTTYVAMLFADAFG